MLVRTLLFAALMAASASPTLAADWVRAGSTTNQPVWGSWGGLQFALHPAGWRGREGGPRGLIRLGYPILTNGGYDLVNFLAVEPIVNGRRGFSELERSTLDRTQGKRFWTGANAPPASTNRVGDPGRLSELAGGVQQLTVLVQVEPFDNGAHVSLVLGQRSDRPDELEVTVQTEKDSAQIEQCILTATMGNMARTRQLWLKDEVVSSLDLFPDYWESGFTDAKTYPLERLQLTPDGDVLVALTTNEDDPAAVFPFPGSWHWHYGGRKVTQYWRKPKDTVRADLQAVVNARFTYWMSQKAIPGGVAFENFELRERFYEGQQFVFGITRKTPAELGFARKP